MGGSQHRSVFISHTTQHHALYSATTFPQSLTLFNVTGDTRCFHHHTTFDHSAVGSCPTSTGLSQSLSLFFSLLRYIHKPGSVNTLSPKMFSFTSLPLTSLCHLYNKGQPTSKCQTESCACSDSMLLRYNRAYRMSCICTIRLVHGTEP